MVNGVQILLEPRTRLPWWLKLCRGVTIRIEEVSGRRVKVVKIIGGRACFFISGSILVEHMPGYKGKLGLQLTGMNQGVANPALQIRDLTGKVLEQNYYLCEKCFRNTGKIVKHEPSLVVAGREEAIIRCDPCGVNWQRRI